jgi:membrane protein YqaA with SNARE-associated domain
VDHLLTWGYPGLFLAGFIAGSAIPMSSEAALSAAIACGWPSWPCLWVVFAGNWCGASTNYFIGRFASVAWIEKYLRLRREKLERTRRFLHGRGIWLAAISFLPFLGNALVVAYGMLRAPFWKVGGLMFLGRLLRYIVWMYLTAGVIQLWWT